MPQFCPHCNAQITEKTISVALGSRQLYPSIHIVGPRNTSRKPFQAKRATMQYPAPFIDPIAWLFLGSSFVSFGRECRVALPWKHCCSGVAEGSQMNQKLITVGKNGRNACQATHRDGFLAKNQKEVPLACSSMRRIAGA